MRVLITGGAGYIGTELTTVMARDPDYSEITVYDNLSRSNYNLFLGLPFENREKISFVRGDILDSRSLQTVMANVDIVYHLAAKVSTPFADHGPHAFDQVNHWGAAEVVNAIERNNISYALFASSASVYGATSEEVDESSELNPQTFYGISKANAETHFARIYKNTHCHSIRCGNVYGYNSSMRFDSVINKLLFEANFHGRVTINGDGKQVRSFVHIASVAQALAKLPKSNLGSGTFNLIEQTLSVNEIVEALKTIYPSLESIHVNRDSKLRELRVALNERLNGLIGGTTTDFQSALQQFSKSFSF